MATCENEMGMHAHRKLKLLVVDDDPNTRALLRDALEMRGAEVLASASVREAAEASRILAAGPADFRVGMPVEDGYELSGRLRDAPTAAGGARRASPAPAMQPLTTARALWMRASTR